MTKAVHVEVTIGARKGTGHLELVDIQDIQLETCTAFGQTEAPLFRNPSLVSLVKGDESGRPNASSEDKVPQRRMAKTTT